MKTSYHFLCDWLHFALFSSHRKKRMKQLQKKLKSGAMDVRQDDPFDLFIAATPIRYCYYAETFKILGSTYGMCVLQVSGSCSVTSLTPLLPVHRTLRP